MSYLLNSLYLLASFLLSPWLIYKAITTGKYRRGLLSKLIGSTTRRDDAIPCAWFHGVSVGEIHLLRQVVAQFRRRHPDWTCVISTTTDTGYAEAGKHFPDLSVFYWPLDFSWAVKRALRRVQPDLVILAEGEIWPNFLSAAKKQGVPVAVINGRLSPRSANRYRLLRGLARSVLGRVDLLAVQTEEYAAAFGTLGAHPAHVHVTGNVKYDGVSTDRHNPRTEALRRLLALQASDLVWIAGSTQAPEEAMALDIYRRLHGAYPSLRLLIVPRQKDRFEEVANLLAQTGVTYVRRSALTQSVQDRTAVVLVDTIGELSALWGLADIALVGGSFDGRRGGQNMIEPAAYGAAVIFGPHVWNFRDAADRLVRAGAARQAADAAELESVMRRLLNDAAERQRLGMAAQKLVQAQQGATARTIDLLTEIVQQPKEHPRAA